MQIVKLPKENLDKFIKSLSKFGNLTTTEQFCPQKNISFHLLRLCSGSP